MKFKILESSFFSVPNAKAKDIEEIADYIIKNCQPILQIYKSTVFKFYRGLVDDPSDIIIKDVRKDREPKDTVPVISKLFDDLLFKKFKWHPRQEGLFITSNRNEAQSYGFSEELVHVIFPVGKFKYVWSPSIIDFWTEFQNRSMYDEEFDAGRYTKSEMIRKFGGIVREMFSSYTDKNIKIALNNHDKRCEVMVKCDRYVAIEFDIFKQVNDELKKKGAL